MSDMRQAVLALLNAQMKGAEHGYPFGIRDPREAEILRRTIARLDGAA